MIAARRAIHSLFDATCQHATAGSWTLWFRTRSLDTLRRPIGALWLVRGALPAWSRMDAAQGMGSSVRITGRTDMAYSTRREYDDERPSSPPSRPVAAGEDPFSRFLGRAVGCLLGLAAGYWLLNYVGGPAFNVLNVPLPFVEHTQADWVDADGVESESPSDSTENIDAPRVASPYEATQPRAASRSSPRKRKRPRGESLATGSDTSHIDTAAPKRAAAAPPPATVRRDQAVRQATAVEPSTQPEDRTFQPRFSVAELDSAIEDARDLFVCERCDSTGSIVRQVTTGALDRNGRRAEQQSERRVRCPECQGNPLRLDRPGYQRLCDLALRATFVDFSDEEAEAVPARAEAIGELVQRLGADAQLRRNLGRRAAERLGPASAGEGVVLAGTVREVKKRGQFTCTRLSLFGEDRDVVIISNVPSTLKPRDAAIVLGTVVDRPGNRLAGLGDGDEIGVWGGMPVRLSNLR